MQTRHRIPSIFNLSMVDVLCCALGCVILLWLLNMREARDRAAEAGQTETQLREMEQEFSTTSQQLAAAQKDLETARGELTRLLLTTATLTADLDRTKDQAMANRQRYETAEEQARAVAMLLEKTRTELEKKLALSGKRAEDMAGKLGDAETRIKQLGAMADQLPGLRDELKSYRDKFAAEQALAGALEKTIQQRLRELEGRDKELMELRTARTTLETGIAARDRELLRVSRNLLDLEGEKKSLLSEMSRVRTAAENRFAGISLTGQRVLFVIDRSGSMGLLDADTESKEKWPAVRQAVARIMRSLPDLEKFQVLVFAQDAAFLLGQDGRWLDFDARTSPDRVLDALAATEPKGGTNLHSALDAAFRYRSLGLDTIYLISDGLPDRGVALPANGQNWGPVERSDYLSKHLRRTLKTDWNRPLTDGSRVRIHCVGFFYESPDVGAFLWALARENDGSFVGMSKP